MHDARVGARRARSTLRTFAKLFPGQRRKLLEQSLREYAAELGEVRDLQVLRQLMVEHAKGDLATWLATDIDRSLFAAWQRLERALANPQHHELQGDMTALLLGPVARELDVAKHVRKAGRRADKRLAEAGTSAERLHDARKAAKRARYAAEAAGGPDQAIDHYERLQDLLGRHHDLVVAAAYVDRADPPHPLGEDAAELAARLRAEAESVRHEAIACLP